MMKRLAALTLLGTCAVPALAQTTFHGHVARTGVYETPGPRHLGGVKWIFKTGGPIVSSPAVADGVVYITSLDGHLYAIDEETGKEKWTFKSRMPIASSPAVAGGLVYFVSSTGALAAIDRETGKPRWVFATEFERKFEAKNLHGYPSTCQTIPDAWDLFTSSPAVVNGSVFFGSGDGNVYSVGATSGLLQWKFSTRDVVHASPAVAGGTGTLAWEFQTEASKADRMKILNAEGSLNQEAFPPLFGDFEDMYIDVYRFASIGAIVSSPAVDRGAIYFGSMDATCTRCARRGDESMAATSLPMTPARLRG